MDLTDFYKDNSFEQKPILRTHFFTHYQFADKEEGKPKIMTKHDKARYEDAEEEDRLIKIANRNALVKAKKLSHPNLLKIRKLYDDAYNFYIITDFSSTKELYEEILTENNFLEEKCQRLFLQLMSAVAHLHSRGIMHRSLHPECLWLDQTNAGGSVLRISNYENVAIYDQEDTKLHDKNDFECLINYTAPELLDGKYNEKCDVWSCGCILYMMLCGKPMFECDNADELAERVRGADFGFDDECFEEVGEECRDLIRKMVTVNVGMRLGAGAVLEHEWFKVEF